MTLPGETVGYIEEGIECPDCGQKMCLEILRTSAYYLGYSCESCGPFSRESGYYFSRGDADRDLKRVKAGQEMANKRA